MTNSEHISYHHLAGPLVKKICQNPNCGKEFWTLGYGSKYCRKECRDEVQNANPVTGSTFITPEIAKYLEETMTAEDTFFADAGMSKDYNKMETRICFFCHRPFDTIANRPAILCSRPDCIGHNLLIAIAKTQHFIVKRIAKRNNKLRAFFNKEFGELDAYADEDGVAWFVGKQAAEMLGYKDTKSAIIAHVHDEDKKLLDWSQVQRWQITTFASPRGLTVINLFGFNDLIIHSKLPAAKRIQHWITHDVMPKLLVQGYYSFVEQPSVLTDYFVDEELLMLLLFRELMGGDVSLLADFNRLTDAERQIIVQLIKMLHARHQLEPPTLEAKPEQD